MTSFASRMFKRLVGASNAFCFTQTSNLSQSPSPPPYKLQQNLPSNELMPCIAKCTDIGLENNYLVYIESDEMVVRDRGIAFQGRLVKKWWEKPSNINSKQRHSSSQSSTVVDPFMPPFAAGSHVCDLRNGEYRLLLNKYCVVLHHVLIVTAAFHHQSDALTASDFEVAMQVVQSMNGLCYFNRGPVSGASQPHKHLQVIPDGDTYTIHRLMQPLVQMHIHANQDIALHSLDQYAFIHRAYVISEADRKNGDCDGERLCAVYERMLHEIKLEIATHHGEQYLDDETFSYNLLMTKDFLLLVPRKQENYFADDHDPDVKISINAMGFAGSFFCKNEQGLDVLQKIGPMTILDTVAFAKPLVSKI